MTTRDPRDSLPKDLLLYDGKRHAAGQLSRFRVLITGASGMIGVRLSAFLSRNGHEVMCLVRRPPARDQAEIYWDPTSGTIDAAALEGFDALVHLSGENIGSGRWTKGRRQRIADSRGPATEFLARTLANLGQPPDVLISASAVGIYGETTGMVDESAPKGSGFLSEVTAAWEQATEPAQAAGIRVVHARFGPVLSPEGGILKRLLPVFLAGAGGVVGSGEQPLSWISLADAVGALYFLLATKRAHGAVNVVCPQPATNREFTRSLAAVLSRPAFLPVPAIAIRALFGEMGNELILKGQAVVPARLTELGFRWLSPELAEALRWELKLPAD